MSEALRSRYTWLLIGLLSLALVLPFMQENRVGLLALHALSVVFVAVGVAAVAKRRRHVVAALALAAPSLSRRWAMATSSR